MVTDWVSLGDGSRADDQICSSELRKNKKNPQFSAHKGCFSEKRLSGSNCRCLSNAFMSLHDVEMFAGLVAFEVPDL